ncbi:hypothetical protein CYPRO_0424 [Cyclonatronum proteinivorum]|uniref:DUF2191 domain-containing protein n=1 Tax=Cyclonatronum proteinivorum TaxID=1457365 RepID=A0A345UGV9_9BACT|nr:hypothetical protein [Cyclonatronum proteinivorum]AXI99710.1 hypothetical protein CYPRO_0424 [Cyclonatronum proteinivorum]
MRTTIDIPDTLFKQAKIKAVEEGITMKELFIKALTRELSENQLAQKGSFPWEKLRGTGSTAGLQPDESGFDGYNGPDLLGGMAVNDPSQD